MVNAIPAEPKSVRRERTDTPNRTGKKQQKCLDILGRVLAVLAGDRVTATARDDSLPMYTMQRDEQVCEV